MNYTSLDHDDENDNIIVLIQTDFPEPVYQLSKDEALKLDHR